ncbi:tRNA lysidine(34) synthetase TilS [Candidatus Karelsulcia muelleri]|uniref:tRNA lysidine(34) synthetase TilS n=1 Tax=Candidatus Karelsulcia muelleri TaxID=336810 RepID=UPI00194E57ED|nr:tRNA lysidine(34) synthetase TilS [Candidatus Karelsulcia muelleri]
MLNFKTFLKTLKDKIDLKQKKIYIAVSGGVDSLVLLDLFFRIKDLKIEVLHCNFKLRGAESEEEENLIKTICKKKKIILHTKSFNIRKKSSKQILARKLRYLWFKKMLKTNYFNYIALGHHLNDSIETIFLNLIRGTGIKGIKGIVFKKKYLIRPLLDFTKKEILSYAKNHKISWIEDSSNINETFLRNKIRKILNKVLNNEAYLGIKKSFNILKYEYLMINNHLNIIKKYIFLKTNIQEKTLSLKNLFNLNPIKIYLYKLLKVYYFNNIRNLIQIIISKSGKKINSNNSYFSIKKKKKHLILYRNKKYEKKNFS